MRFFNLLLVSAISCTSIISSAVHSAPKTKPPATSGDACKGREAWIQYNCAGCHGARSTGGMGPNILGDSTTSEINSAMQQGETSHGMRKYSGATVTTIDTTTNQATSTTLTSTQVSTIAANISAYLQTIKSSNSKAWLVVKMPIGGGATVDVPATPDTRSEPTFVDWWNTTKTHNMMHNYYPMPLYTSTGTAVSTPMSGEMAGKTCP